MTSLNPDMKALSLCQDPTLFSSALHEKMKSINPGLEELEPYEFRYCLDNICPEGGSWSAVQPDEPIEIERRVNSEAFYNAVQIKPRIEGRIVLDESAARLTQTLFVGLVTGRYPVEWVNKHFYFDIRGFYFLHRTTYLTGRVLAHLGGRPFKSFEQRQKPFDRCQDIGYRAFRAANAEVDGAFIASMARLVAVKGTPLLLGIAGPTAAGKTEIVERLRTALAQAAWTTTSVEMDNFLTDRDQREERGIGSLGKEAIHYELFKRSLEEISRGCRISTPRYDFLSGTSSHDLSGRLRAGCTAVEVEPADLVLVEGNAPFLLPEIAPLIGIKVVYLTDDPIRLKRKWKRDIDYRKKYEPSYFRNRFFKEQFLMAERCYVPQMELCDTLVDTTGAALWTTPEIAGILQPS